MTTADETPVRSNAGGVMDWGVGHYEATADRLMPAADVVVRCAQLQCRRSGPRSRLRHG